MKLIRVFLISFLLAFYLVFPAGRVFSQDTAYVDQEGRYVLVTVSSEGIYARTMQKRVPAVVLDSVRGIVWRCKDLQEDRPLWIKTDLAKNGDKPMAARKYVVTIPQAPGNELRIPAIVVDTAEGKAWTCRDVTSEDAVWVGKDLVQDIKGEGYKYGP